MKKYLSLFIVFSFIISTGMAFAEETMPMPGNGLPKGVRPGAKPREEVKERVETRRENISEKKEEVKERLETRRENMDERKEELKDRVEAKKAEMENMSEEEKQAMKAKAEAARKVLQEKREALKEKAEKMREVAKTKMEALKAKAKDAASLRRYEGRENALHRFDNQVEKVTTLRDRLQTKITEVEARGVDATVAKTHIANADIKFEEAKTKIAEMNTVLASSTGELTTENKTKIQTLAKDAGTLLKDAYNELNLGVKALKEAVLANTSSTSTSTN